MNALETTAPPTTAQTTGSGEQPAHIFVKIIQAAANTAPLRDNPDALAARGVICGTMFENRLKASLLEARIPGAEVGAIGGMDTMLALISLERIYATDAIIVVKRILKDTKLEATSSIHWLRDPNEPFRIAHYGNKLGPPVTMTLADARAEQAALYQKSRAVLEALTPEREAEIFRILSQSLASSPPPPADAQSDSGNPS